MVKISHAHDFGILLLRIAIGGVFLIHGIAKLQSIEGTTAFFASLGFGAAIMWLVTLVEILAGAAVLLGVYVRYAAPLLAAVMLGSIIFVKGELGYFQAELDLVLLFVSLALALIGAGKYALIRCTTCANGTCADDCECNDCH